MANWPAASAQVLIPNRAHSIASVRIMFSTAARAAPEWTIAGIPLWGERVTLITLPPPCGMKALVAAAWVISQVPVTLSSITVRKPLAEIDSAGARNWPPALLTSTSRRPWRSEQAVEEALDRLLLADVERLELEAARQARRQRGGLRQRLARGGRSRPRSRRGGPAPAPSRARSRCRRRRRRRPRPSSRSVPEYLRMRAFSHRSGKPIGAAPRR